MQFDDQPWEQLRPKLQAELAAGQPTYDFFYGDIEFQYSTYPALVDLTPLIKKYNYDMEGFFEPVYKFGEGVAGGLEGQRFGLPIRIGACWVFYRTDLIKEFPKTWDDYYKFWASRRPAASTAWPSPAWRPSSSRSSSPVTGRRVTR